MAPDDFVISRLLLHLRRAGLVDYVGSEPSLIQGTQTVTQTEPRFSRGIDSLGGSLALGGDDDDSTDDEISGQFPDAHSPTGSGLHGAPPLASNSTGRQHLGVTSLYKAKSGSP